MRRTAAVGICVLGAVAALATMERPSTAISGSVEQGGERAPNAREIRDIRAREDTEFKRGGLEAAAAVTGNYSRNIPIVAVGGPANLVELVTESDVVVIGRIASQIMRPTNDGRSIATICQVDIESTAKGERLLGRISVAVPGGKVSLPTGAVATLRVDKFQRPQNGRRYVMFLKSQPLGVRLDQKDSVANSSYVLANVYLGLYDVSSDVEVVRPDGTAWSPVAKEIASARLQPQEFVARVSEAIRQSRQ